MIRLQHIQIKKVMKMFGSSLGVMMWQSFLHLLSSLLKILPLGLWEDFNIGKGALMIRFGEEAAITNHLINPGINFLKPTDLILRYLLLGGREYSEARFIYLMGLLGYEFYPRG